MMVGVEHRMAGRRRGAMLRLDFRNGVDEFGGVPRTRLCT